VPIPFLCAPGDRQAVGGKRRSLAQKVSRATLTLKCENTTGCSRLCYSVCNRLAQRCDLERATGLRRIGERDLSCEPVVERGGNRPVE
jgi:hypothetical protein